MNAFEVAFDNLCFFFRISSFFFSIYNSLNTLSMLISASLSAFLFSAFSLLAPFFIQRLSALSACFRGRGRSKNVFSHPENGRGKLSVQNSSFAAKNRDFPQKIAGFPQKIAFFPRKFTIFASVSARKYLLAHFSFQRIYGYQRLFPFSAFFSIQRHLAQNALNENR